MASQVSAQPEKETVSANLSKLYIFLQKLYIFSSSSGSRKYDDETTIVVSEPKIRRWDDDRRRGMVFLIWEGKFHPVRLRRPVGPGQRPRR
jgi:hypothetical protein